jgi:hypothetical protein
MCACLQCWPMTRASALAWPANSPIADDTRADCA